MRSKVIRIAHPETISKVIEGTNAWCVINRETTDDGGEMVQLHLTAPGSDAWDLHHEGNKIASHHVGREPGLRAKDGVPVLHKSIHPGKIEPVKLLNHSPGLNVKAEHGIRIMFF